MTAQTMLAVPPRREEETSPRPVSWRRMAWITWRQHRIALGGAAAFLGALAVYLWLAGLQLHHAYAATTACHPASSILCANKTSDFVLSHDHTATIIPGLLQVVPALIGAFVGAPVLARELETGTFRYAWTQGFGRWRWTLAKLVMLAVVVTAAAGAFGLLFSWYYRPFIADGQNGPFTSIVFDLRGIAFAAWTLTAFAIGALAGILIRRVVPAIVAALAAYTALAVAAGLFLRRHYLTPLVTRKLNVPGSAWIYHRWWTKGSTFAFSGRPPVSLLQSLCPPSAVGAVKAPPGSLAGLSATQVAKATLAQCLSRHGYAQWTRYQPVSRFWSFQLIEAGWLFALSILLIGATVWAVRQRAA
jgi:hypothetical protein